MRHGAFSVTLGAMRRGLNHPATCVRCGVVFMVEKYRAETASWCSRACRFPPERDRFVALVQQSDACWNWQGFRNALGYGQFGRNTAAHRYAHELWVGPIPSGYDIDHLCRNHSCVRPDHLEAVTHRVNILRGHTFAARYAAQTRCKNGHPFDEANTYWRPNGGRNCRACGRENAARYANQSSPLR